MSQFSGRRDIKRGAVPKQCPKCHVPSDYYHHQQIKQHDVCSSSFLKLFFSFVKCHVLICHNSKIYNSLQLDQAHEQIRDLNLTVEQLQHELQLSYAAQAKLKAVAEIARTESKNALSFLNSRMLSTVVQYRPKIANVDNTMVGTYFLLHLLSVSQY